MISTQHKEGDEMGAKNDASTTKYEIRALFEVDGVVEKPDIIGAIYGQTDGLLSEDLDIRELQKTGRIGRINVEVYSEEGKTKGRIIVPSSLSRVETAILAATLETIDRVGPCSCTFKLEEIIDVRINKRKAIVDRAAEIIRQWDQNVSPFTSSITLEVEKSSKSSSSVVTVGKEGFTAGPGFENSKKVILVEGRADVGNLLKYGIDNTIAVNGTSVPPKIVEILKDKKVTAFLDGDRGGDLILKELLQVSHVEYVARAPLGKEVEDLTQEEITKALKEAVPLEKAVFLTGTDKGLTVAQFLKNQQKAKNQKMQKTTPPKVSRPPKAQPAIQQVKTHRTKQTTAEPQPKQTVSPRTRRTDKASTKQPLVHKKPQYKKPAQPQRKEIQKVKLPEYIVSVVNDVNEKLEAVVLSENREVLRSPASEIYEKLSTVEKAETLIIDGVITQRLLDRAYRKGINMIVGARIGDITKKPTMLKLLEFKQIYK